MPDSRTIIREGAVLHTRGPGPALVAEGDDLVAAVAGVAWLEGERVGAEALMRLAERFQRGEGEILAAVEGSFLLALIDRRYNKAMLAVDRFGSYNLCYAACDGGVVFGPTPAAVAAHPRVDASVDDQALYDYLYFHMVPAPATAFREVRRLPPGHALMWAGARAYIDPYWHYAFNDSKRTENFERARQELFDRLEAAVARCSDNDRYVGAFLSGGTDSSTVAGILSRVRGAPPDTFAIGFAAEGYDETEYARSAAEHFRTRHHEYYVTPEDVEAAVPLVTATYGQPYGNASAVPTLFCARLAAEAGIEILLGGDGGDELFGGNERYAKQWLFSMYDRIPAVVRRRLLEPALVGSRSPRGISAVQKIARYVEQASIPMPDRMESYNLLANIGPDKLLTEEFRAAIDPDAPLHHMRAVYANVRAENIINKMLGFDMRITLSDNDLPKVSGMCSTAGVDARFPMLEEGLAEYASQLPPEWKVHGTRLRYFVKRALRDFLPDKTISKKKHGFGLPFGVWMSQNNGLRNLAGDSLKGLADRGIIRPQAVDDLIYRQIYDHPGYYGTFVWVLMMLEQWLSAGVPASGAAEEIHPAVRGG